LERPPKILTAQDTEIVAMLIEESDAGLLRIMGQQKQDAAWADAAFKVFHNRHSHYHWTVCLRVAHSLNGDAWAEDIFKESFSRAYEKAGSFTLPAGKSSDEERRLVRGWLGTIAENCLRMLLRHGHLEDTHNEEEWQQIEANESKKCPANTRSEYSEQEIRTVHRALDALTEREQLVIRTTFQYFRLNRQFQRLPNHVTQELADQLGTTSDNLRKIRQRALDRIRQIVDQKDEASGMASSI
jgi:RNA polymerase sigma factor (sigma-70 family)